MHNIVVLIVCVSVLGCSQPEVGKPALAERPIPADLVVLSQDILTVPVDTVPELQVDMTILGGVILYGR